MTKDNQLKQLGLNSEDNDPDKEFSTSNQMLIENQVKSRAAGKAVYDSQKGINSTKVI